MYIPLTFFSSQGSCITATTSTTSGTGSVTTGSFISGGVYWEYYQFNNNAITEETNPQNYNVNFTILSGSTSQAKLFLVGAGGAGGLGKQTICTYSGEITAGGGGGGGGIVYYNNLALSPGTYQVSVGVGGGNPSRPGRQGGNTTFNYTNSIMNYTNSLYPFTNGIITAYGGGYGGWVEQYPCSSGPLPGTAIWYQGNSGGSAGGNVNINGNGLGVQTQPCCNGLGGLNGENQGFAGGYGINFANTANGSGGGGAGGAGQTVDQNSQQNPGYGGPGQSWSLNGTSLTYAAGGGAVRAQGFPIINQTSADGVGTAGIGNGGHGSSDYYNKATQGTSGTVIVAWPICSTKFSCKTFDIIGATGTLSYLPCNIPYVTQSAPSNPQDYFTACLLTWSGSNTPVLLTGAGSTTAGAECGNQLTQSYDCNCTYIRAVAGSGTQTLTYFPCNGSGSVTTTVGTGGSNFCIENLSIPTLTGVNSTITYYGNCKAGTTCTGIQYTSSIANCSSVLATAGSSGGTLTWLPCGSGSATSSYLAPFQSMSVCAGFTTSFLGLTGVGSTLQTLGACSASVYFTYSIIQNCSSSVTASALLNSNGSYYGNYYPSTGITFISNTTGLAGSCWNVIGTASIASAPTYANVITQSSFTDCANCLASLGIDYLVVGGGGAGGGYAGGGGGAGQYQSATNSVISKATTYPVIIGDGGVGAGFKGTNGGSSSFNGNVSIGGGAGGALSSGGDPAITNGNSGSSGGGGSYYTNAAGGTGTAGNNGGNGIDGTGNANYSGGGGGAAAVGANGSSTSNGGNGSQWLDGNYYAGGGGGYRGGTLDVTRGLGGLGGGGTSASGVRNASSGSPNTGGGGGGGLGGIPAENYYGGSGIVKIRYYGTGSQATGGTISYSGSYTYHTFTSSGNFITN